MKNFVVCVSGTIYVEVTAEHEEMAQAMIEASLLDSDVFPKKYGLTEKQGIALSQIKDSVIDVYEVPET